MPDSPPPPFDHDSPSALLELLQCLTRALRDEVRQGALAHGLLPVHWQILWFLHIANRYSNTVQTLTAYLGQTKGSVSQTLQLLESRGYLLRRADETDRRVTRLTLTEKGHKVVAAVEAGGRWHNAANELPRQQLGEATRALSALLRNWQQSTAGNSFGVCHSCALLQIEGEQQFRCGMTQETLNTEDLKQICQAHLFPATDPGN